MYRYNSSIEYDIYYPLSESYIKYLSTAGNIFRCCKLKNGTNNLANSGVDNSLFLSFPDFLVSLK